MFEGQRVGVEHIAQNAVPLATITPDAHEQHLAKILDRRLVTSHVRIRTSLILDFKKGFLMYQVEVKNVRTNVISSTLPAISNFSGDVLRNDSVCVSIKSARVLTGRHSIDSPRYPRQCTLEEP